MLIEAILRRSRFSNLSLVMVDGWMKPGERAETLWGTTPVTLRGPCPQDRIGELYGEFDVLLAPSLWPESYGLVTREALFFGKWVVASALGAIGDCVVEGENGFRVDLAEPQALARVLERLDSDPQRYTTPPPQSGDLRGAGDQAAELLALYRSVIDGTNRRP